MHARITDYPALLSLVPLDTLEDGPANWLARVDLAADQQRLHVNNLTDQIKQQQAKIVRQKAALKAQDAAILERNRLLDAVAPEQRTTWDLLKALDAEFKFRDERVRELSAAREQIARMQRAEEKRAEVEGVSAQQVTTLSEQKRLLLKRIKALGQQRARYAEEYQQTVETAKVKIAEARAERDEAEALLAHARSTFHTTAGRLRDERDALKVEISELRARQDRDFSFALVLTKTSDRARRSQAAKISELQAQLDRSLKYGAHLESLHVARDPLAVLGYRWQDSQLKAPSGSFVARISADIYKDYRVHAAGEWQGGPYTYDDAKALAEKLVLAQLNVTPDFDWADQKLRDKHGNVFAEITLCRNTQQSYYSLSLPGRACIHSPVYATLQERAERELTKVGNA